VKNPFHNDIETSATEVVSDNEPIISLVNNAIFSQHDLNDNATKSNSLARRDGRCFNVKEVVHCHAGGMLVTFDILRIKDFCSKI
jgi:hypothetical protein